MKKLTTLLFSLCAFVAANAQNPYLPLWEHVPDGEPRVFEDPDNPGKLRAYIIGSHDVKNTEYCGPDIRMWSAPVENLADWRDEGPIFTHYVDGQWDTMFAPDLVEVFDKESGKKVVKEMNKVGMVIDLSHASMGTFWDVMKERKMPVVCTHSGAKDVFFHNRNLNDDQLRALAKNGGVIQVCIFASYMTADASKTSIDDVVAHIDHCVKVAGIDHVGVGSDFDGGGGVIGCRGSNDMIMITVKLLEKGYTEQDLKKIWGGNFFRVMNKCRSVAKK